MLQCPQLQSKLAVLSMIYHCEKNATASAKAMAFALFFRSHQTRCASCANNSGQEKHTLHKSVHSRASGVKLGERIA